MRRNAFLLVVLFGFAAVVTGCAKKAADEQANLASSNTINGFDSLATTEELAQLPQASSSNSNQQQGVEVLPIETSPVTQQTAVQAGAAVSQAVSQGASAAASASGLSHEQQIQTALKNAGFYNGNVDGKIGPASKKAIEAFQKSNGLKADGKVGPKTWAALEQFVNGAPSSATSSVQSAQQ